MSRLPATAGAWCALAAVALVFGVDHPATQPPSRPAVTYANDFTTGLDDFAVEQEQPARVSAADGVLMIDAPAGVTVWLKRRLGGPTRIDYDAVVVNAGGPNDRVSDLNCFWMADDPARPGELLARPRGGKFADYDTMTAYYCGIGGNANTTTRFRRYVGRAGDRPIRPQDDLRDAGHLLKPNIATHVTLIADGPRVEVWRDGERLFAMDDAEPYQTGWFGWRTVKSHLEIRNFRVTTP